MIMTTKHPAEVKAAFEEFAKYLYMLANDQIASQRWQTRKIDKAVCYAKAEAYSSLAMDIHAMKFEQEGDAK